MLTQRTNILKIALWSIPALVIIVLILGYSLYHNLYKANVFLTETTEKSLYIKTGSTFEDLCESLVKEKKLIHEGSFRRVARRLHFETVKPGKYTLRNGMNNLELVRMLRAGQQTPVRVTFNNVRNTNQLSGILSRQLEPDSAAFSGLFSDTIRIIESGFTRETFPAIFIPNTYEFFWNTTPEQFLSRISREYATFWNEKRQKKADSLGLTPVKISILASIVEEETKKNDEKPRVAGVYLNRIKKNIPLQSDPTVKFAAGDPTLRRILTKHLKLDSPYNTYIHPGLPPGPICFPEISSIDAVLNAENHNYIFFCAREDFSGYHNFAKTLAEHNRNANAYHKALNKAGIR
jgi:UPF0755 protein